MSGAQHKTLADALAAAQAEMGSPVQTLGRGHPDLAPVGDDLERLAKLMMLTLIGVEFNRQTWSHL